MSQPGLSDWLGRRETQTVYADPAIAARLAAILDYQTPPPEPPLLWHWLLFTPDSRQSDLDQDGHPRRGGFLPPIELPRRMWAGGDLQFHRPLLPGEPLERRTTLAELQRKQGRSGELLFLTLQHDYFQADRLCLQERQDIVYRDGISPAKPAAAAHASTTGSASQQLPATARLCKTLVADPTLLFRYSAATFNAHRIHYDRDYATGVEGYPSLVVQGPLLATVLLDMLRQHSKTKVVRFSFRAERPVFDDQAIHFTASPDEAAGESAAQWQLAVHDERGQRCMQARAELAGNQD